MFKRKILVKLEEWKKNSINNKRKAFVIKGLRQIGKTTVALEFAKKHYQNVIYINFKTEAYMKDAFNDGLDVDTLITNISSRKRNQFFIPHKTVIIFDEIQECSSARASIKPFVEDGRFDIIATGSLLGVEGYNSKYSGGTSVGFEHIEYMYSMDFEEFLWAKGVSTEVIDGLKKCFEERKPINKITHDAMTRYFKEYICVGGMPSVVSAFIETNDMNQVLNEQRDLLNNYRDDYGKHLDENEKEVLNKTLLARINRVFDSIPVQLAKENKKFQYSTLGKGSSGGTYETAIQWLKDYGLINICYNLSSLDKPLEGNKIYNIFKLYMVDSGLFIAMLDDGTAGEILAGNMGIYKGAIYENIIADLFTKQGRKLYYYSKCSGLEIDFVTQFQHKISLIEVKATNGKTKSSKTILEDKKQYPDVQMLIKLCDSNISITDNMIVIPHYLGFLLPL